MTKANLLALLSLELFLYSLYLPILLVTLVTMPEFRSTIHPARELLRMLIIFGPPCLVLVVNGRMARTLVRNARRDERRQQTKRFGLGLMVVQAALIVFIHVMPMMMLVTAWLSLSGLIISPGLMGD